MKKIYLLALALFSITANAQTEGTLDPTFNTTGIFAMDFGHHDNLTDVKVLSDQKIVVCGTAINDAFGGDLLVARLLPDGTLDNTFNGTGYQRVTQFQESYGYEIIPLADGKILVAGSSANPSYVFSMTVVRLNSDGTVDTSFGVDGFAIPEFGPGDETAMAAVGLSDGKILLAGMVMDDQFRNVPAIVRLKEDGNVDTAFGVEGIVRLPVTDIDNELSSIALQADGKIVVSGHIDHGLNSEAMSDFDVLVARLLPDGTLDDTFSADGIANANFAIQSIEDCFGLALDNAGNIYTSGFTTMNDMSWSASVVKFNTDGTIDTSFGTNGVALTDAGDYNQSQDIEWLANGQLIVAGSASTQGFMESDYMIYRLNSNGTADTSFGTNGIALVPILSSNDEANGMAIQADGKLILAGKSTNITNDITVARFNYDAVINVENILSENSTLLYPNPAQQGSTLSFSAQASTIKIFDMTGSCVYSAKSKSNGNGSELQLPTTLSSGVYVVQFGNQAVRLVVE